MSRIQTIHVKLERCDKYISRFFDKETEHMDEFELSDYCSDKNIYKVGGSWWEEVHKEEFEEFGFTKILSQDNSSVEFITQFYNGGCSLDGLVGEVLNETI